MTNEKFTPGEWAWYISDNGDGFPIIYSGDTDIAEVYLPNGNSEQMLSNAALIAAAPEMYKMLAITRKMFEDLADVIPNEQAKDLLHDMASDIESVLKKARGEE